VVPGVGKTTSNNTIKFTGQYRDTDSAANLDYFGARYYSNTVGRFMSPDWAAKPTTVPYAKFGDSQSLNLYSYVGNEPINRIDTDGHNYAGWNGAYADTSGGFTEMDNEVITEWGINSEGMIRTEAANEAMRQQAAKNMVVAVPTSFGQDATNELTRIFNNAKINIEIVHYEPSSGAPDKANFVVEFAKLPGNKVGNAATGNAKVVQVDSAKLYTLSQSKAVKAQVGKVSLDTALGRVAAHEIGHKFLGPHIYDASGHALNFPTGIMRDIANEAIFDGYMNLDNSGGFDFTEGQRTTIYSECCH